MDEHPAEDTQLVGVDARRTAVRVGSPIAEMGLLAPPTLRDSLIDDDPYAGIIQEGAGQVAEDVGSVTRDDVEQRQVVASSHPGASSQHHRRIDRDPFISAAARRVQPP